MNWKFIVIVIRSLIFNQHLLLNVVYLMCNSFNRHLSSSYFLTLHRLSFLYRLLVFALDEWWFCSMTFHPSGCIVMYIVYEKLQIDMNIVIVCMMNNIILLESCFVLSKFLMSLLLMRTINLYAYISWIVKVTICW